jgi:NAD(P)-dependent dehydrogenase (short-subunit alcohol dehydrogenase family)
MTWTVADIPDQSGRVAVVTGANSGLGLETATALSGAGAHVVLACRNEEKAATAADHIRGAHPDASVEVVRCDLSSQASVAKAAEGINAAHDRLDLLIDNAGVMAIPRRVTDDGWEMQLATNHLGHFALTAHLLDRLLATDDSRVVVVTSFVHHVGKIRFEDLQSERKYNKWSAYSQSKLANMLFTLELQRRLARADSGTIALASHPGYAATELQATGPRMSGSRIMEQGSILFNRLFAQSAAGGALPSLYAATAPDLAGGELIGPGGFMQQRGAPKAVSPSKRASDPDLARRLWEVSEDLTGVKYPV